MEKVKYLKISELVKLMDKLPKDCNMKEYHIPSSVGIIRFELHKYYYYGEEKYNYRLADDNTAIISDVFFKY